MAQTKPTWAHRPLRTGPGKKLSALRASHFMRWSYFCIFCWPRYVKRKMRLPCLYPHLTHTGSSMKCIVLGRFEKKTNISKGFFRAWEGKTINARHAKIEASDLEFLISTGRYRISGHYILHQHFYRHAHCGHCIKLLISLRFRWWRAQSRERGEACVSPDLGLTPLTADTMRSAFIVLISAQVRISHSIVMIRLCSDHQVPAECRGLGRAAACPQLQRRGPSGAALPRHNTDTSASKQVTTLRKHFLFLPSFLNQLNRQ